MLKSLSLLLILPYFCFAQNSIRSLEYRDTSKEATLGRVVFEYVPTKDVKRNNYCDIRGHVWERLNWIDTRIYSPIILEGIKESVDVIDSHLYTIIKKTTRLSGGIFKCLRCKQGSMKIQEFIVMDTISITKDSLGNQEYSK